MFFNIDADEGRAVRGWIALDNPSIAAKLTVVIDGRPDMQIEANLHRPDVQELGIHLTGQVGFEINESLIPDLAKLEDLSILESESRLLIFRRAAAHHVEKKLYLFDASVMTPHKLLSEISAHFTHNYLLTERFSLETMLVIINNHFSKSSFLYGRSNFNRYSSHLNDAGFLRAALLQEPFTELAERLLMLKLIAVRGSSLAASITGFDSVLGFARELDLEDPKAILQAFRRLEPDQRSLFSNPMTRLFGCDVDETPRRRNVSVALENLAAMDVVGLRARFGIFRQMLAGAIGRDVLGSVAPLELDMVIGLARDLSQIGLVADLLDGDRQLYEFAEKSIRSVTEHEQGAVERDTQSS